ncbi:unnamed protein product [Candidula unifasciata]|uniref:Uncharacterized protein n=1 Tax=Candidula unifasciata TaxID=100452 RepID=A0A8S3ZC58_9EUPU|nr:unnamed protein product [Candidula unifasciata]
MAVEVGAEFKTYDDLTNAVRAYEVENYVNLTTRDTRTVEAAAKRNLRKNYNPAIKYSDISYCCTYGGKKYVCHSTGKRSHKSIKLACPFSLKIRATIDGQRLFVREMCSVHNHLLTEAEFRLHPKQRKLDIGSQEEIAHLLSMEPDKKLLRDKLMQITGKVILMKDIHNIKTRLLNPRDRQTNIKKELIERDEGEGASDMKKVHDKDTAEMETQTDDENLEDIHIPIPLMTSSQIGTSNQSVLFHQTDHLVDHSFYTDSQTFQQQTANVFTVSVQAFQPTQVYTVTPDSLQPTSANIIHDSIVADSKQIDPAVVRCSQHFQHWAPLEDVGHQAVQEATNQTIETFAFQEQQQSSTYQAHDQHYPVSVSNSHSVQPVLIKDIYPLHLHQKQEKEQSLLGIRHSRKTPADSVITPKEHKSAEDSDKEVSLKKYFQQAAVNLFFNERLKSPGSKVFPASRPGTVQVKMSEDLKFHEMLKPLSWLFGKWQSTDGKGIYPNVADFTYSEEATFLPVEMKPVVEYKMHSWKTENRMPMHRETGYIKIQPNTNHVAFVAAHIMGVVEIQEGEINGQELCVESKNVGRTSFNSPPEVKLVRRFLRRSGNELEQVIDMQTDKTSLTEHLRITFKRVD